MGGPSPARRVLANLLYILFAVGLGLMIYSMIKGPTNYYYGAIAIVLALLARAAERMQGNS
jgi:hypothetical protein